MKILFFDTETYLIKPGMLTPRVVCLSCCDEEENRLLNRVEGLTWLRKQLSDPQVTLVGHNVVYDLGCYAAEDPSLVPLIFKAYDDGRIRCTQIRQQLINIGKGEHKFRIVDGKFVKTNYHLATLVEYWCKRHLEKEDTYRLRYSELDGIRIKNWPQEAIDYAKNDAVATRDVWQAQDKALEIGIPDEEPQNRAAWALHLASIWGFRTDGVAVAELRKDLEEKLRKAYEILRREGLVRANGKRDMAAIAAQVEKVYEGRTKKTAKGKTQTSKEVLKDSNDPILKILEETSTWRTTLSREVPMLEQGTKFPICPRYNVLVENGRTSCKGERIDGKKVGGNIQNLSRDGLARSCFLPRNGFLFASADYDAAELHSFSQVCLDLLGESQMAEALRRGDDLHIRLAATILGMTYEKTLSKYISGDANVIAARQGAKHAAFGFIGGMGPTRFVATVKPFGMIISEKEATELRDATLKTWPEMKKYFAFISNQIGPLREATIKQLRSGRIRGGVGFCDGCNNYFSGMTADGAKAALYAVSKECYTLRNSPLYGSRPVGFFHDEIMIETPDHRERASAAAYRLSDVMREEMQKLQPDIPVGVSPVLCRRWLKSAKPVFGPDKILLPSKPIRVDGKTKWIHDEGNQKAIACG